MLKNMVIINLETKKTSKVGIYLKKDSNTLELTSPSIENRIFDAPSYFQCLGETRSYLNDKGWLLQCNGALENIFPSRMSIQARSQKAYVLELGTQATRDRLVNIFDHSPIYEYYSFESQQEFYKNWLKSLN